MRSSDDDAEAAPRSVPPQGYIVPFCATRVPHYGRSTTRAPPRVNLMLRHNSSSSNSILAADNITSSSTSGGLGPDISSAEAAPRRSTCDTCCHLHERINATTDMVEKGALQEEKRDHLKKIQASRATYFARRELAQTDPSRYMSLVVDSMEDSTADLHIIGAISHGRRRRAFMFVGSNTFNRRTTIEIVNRVLRATLEAEGGLPPVLHLQLANTATQCNSDVQQLVATGVFEQVTMAYLPMGHTIEEIDQLFSEAESREIIE